MDLSALPQEVQGALYQALGEDRGSESFGPASSDLAPSVRSPATAAFRCLWSAETRLDQIDQSQPPVIIVGRGIAIAEAGSFIAAGARAVYDLNRLDPGEIAQLLAAHASAAAKGAAGDPPPRSHEPNASYSVEAAGETGLSLLAQAVEDLSFGVYVTDQSDGAVFRVWNKRMQRLFHKSEAEVVGRQLDEVFADPLFRNIFSEGKQSFARNRAIIPANPEDGSESAGNFIADITNTVIRDPDGKARTLIGVVHDVTDRVRSENRLVSAFNELEASKEKLEQSNVEIRKGIEKAKKLAVAAQSSNKAKSFLLSNISHELRTPLTSIVSLTHALLEGTFGKVNGAQAENLEIVAESGRHLQALITDILDLSKIELGKMNLKLGSVDLQEISLSSIRMIEQQAVLKNITCAFELATEIKAIEADSKRLRQILLNLLINAVKFTRQNSLITLRIEGSPDQECVLFSVTDHGIGIRDCDISQIFSPFTQLDDSLSRQYEGTGLGLAIVSRFVELHGGGLRVKSEPDKGSSFLISLPIKQVELPATRHGRPSLADLALGGRKPKNLVLIIDDNERVAELIRSRAQLVKGCTPIVTMPNEISAYQDQLSPAVVIVDLACIGDHGSEWIQQAQKLLNWKRTRWIATASLEMQANHTLAERLSLHRFIAKPITQSVFRELLR